VVNFDQILVHRGELINNFCGAGIVDRRPSRMPNKKPRPHWATGDFEPKAADFDQYSQTLTVRRR
jgi:hypothetical protein